MLTYPVWRWKLECCSKNDPKPSMVTNTGACITWYVQHKQRSRLHGTYKDWLLKWELGYTLLGRHQSSCYKRFMSYCYFVIVDLTWLSKCFTNYDRILSHLVHCANFEGGQVRGIFGPNQRFFSSYSYHRLSQKSAEPQLFLTNGMVFVSEKRKCLGLKRSTHRMVSLHQNNGWTSAVLFCVINSYSFYRILPLYQMPCAYLKFHVRSYYKTTRHPV